MAKPGPKPDPQPGPQRAPERPTAPAEGAGQAPPGDSALVEGLYDLILSEAHAAPLQARLAEGWRVEAEEADAEVLPARLVSQLIPRLLAAFETVGQGKARAREQVELANRVLALLREQAPGAGLEADDALSVPARRLLAAAAPRADLGAQGAPPRPGIPLIASDLLVNGQRELRIGSELRKELASADRVDAIVAFLKFSGVRALRAELEAFTARRPGGLRVITTAYMGATERRALDALVALGAQVRISWETDRTRLHAKAWLFERASGFTTAFIGSSNLSHAALHDGLEWNVRVAEVDAPTIVDKCRAAFAQYWDATSFEPYDPDIDGPRLIEQQRSRQRAALARYVKGVHVEPRPHQRRILDALAAEREAGHHHNLVVAATGTGKTLVSAFDYRRLCEAAGARLRLLFVAHRQDILEQSRVAFQIVMQDGGFGELLVGGREPQDGRHVFASIQSLHAERLARLDPEAYDVLIVDEFHHAQAPTYRALLEHARPRHLLGLTATPERADGLDVFGWFGGRVASELRLWDALDEGLLSPFQYFGVADTVDYAAVTFQRSGYDARALSDVITGDQMRAARILDALRRYVTDPTAMKALGFCVSIAHAELMADVFRRAGLPAQAVTSAMPRDDRVAAQQALRRGALVCLFVVDLYNEGVDIPAVDTVLFLRPTESATVFLQQLGRGLRRTDGKACLTVLDFVGNAHQRYRHDVTYRALIGGTRRAVLEAVEQGFPRLPPGCAIVLERQAQEHVLRNLRAALQSGVRGLARELAEVAKLTPGALTLRRFLDEAALTLNDVYANPGRSWTDLRRRARLPWPAPVADETPWLKGAARLLHVDDRERITTWRQALLLPSPPKNLTLDARRDRLLLMLLACLRHDFTDLDQADALLAALWRQDAARQEVRALLDVHEAALRCPTPPAPELDPLTPLRVHATYSRDEVMCALGVFKNGRLYKPREGVVWAPDLKVDVLFVTLQKVASEYSPQTLYRDYPISETLFHWESQHTTSASSPTGQRYIHHQTQGSHVLLFVREEKKVNGLTQPYRFLGACDHLRHTGSRPMAITWRLRSPMPADLYLRARLAAG